jgi:hypothetical protein
MDNATHIIFHIVMVIIKIISNPASESDKPAKNSKFWQTKIFIFIKVKFQKCITSIKWTIFTFIYLIDGSLSLFSCKRLLNSIDNENKFCLCFDGYTRFFFL